MSRTLDVNEHKWQIMAQKLFVLERRQRNGLVHLSKNNISLENLLDTVATAPYH